MKFTISLATSMLVLIAAAASAAATTFTVTNTNNSGPGSLRQAILDSNAAAGSDTIVFDASFNTPRTITLASTITLDPAGGNSLAITGPGANLLTVSGNNAVGIFFISTGDTVSISGLTLAQGRNGNGGSAIDNRGTLTVANAVFASNVIGRAITTQGPLTVSNSTFSSNEGGSGGAINITTTGSASVSNSTFTNNTAGYGGAIYTAGPSLIVAGCTFTDNQATSGSATGQGGGAIHSYTSGTVSISNSTFSGNDEVGNSGGGGAIRNREGTWTIVNSHFTNNTAVSGGGAIQSAGVMNISGSTFTGNSTAGSSQNSRGGAIHTSSKLTLANTVIRDNSASREGGGIYVSTAPFSGEGYFLAITNSTVSANNSGLRGGGIYVSSANGPRLSISGSNISGNLADVPGDGGLAHGGGEGGGIWTDGATTIENSTISGNSADGNGGGVFASHSLLVSGVTLVENWGSQNSSESTGGIYNDAAGIIIRNSIFANNWGFAARDVRGHFQSEGYNLIEETTGYARDATFSGDTATNIIGVDPNLGPLQNNGGPTFSHAPLAGSPVIDKGKRLSAATTDQRGFARPFDHPNISNAANGDGSDIGAFEVQPANTSPGTNVTTTSPSGDASVTFSNVTTAGDTNFAPINPPSSAGSPPAGHTILNNEPAYDITTTASYTPPLTVCFTVSSINTEAEFARVRILHGENGALVDRTILAPGSPAPDFATRRVCARVDSLSPFVVALAPAAEPPPSPTPTPTPTATATPTPTPNPTASPSATPGPSPSPIPASRQLLNIATRLRVRTGENVLIAGVIVTGNAPKKVIIRAVGPSLSDIFDGALADTMLELYRGETLLASNDNWKDSQQAEIEHTTIPPNHELESAIVYTLDPGFYSAIMSGKAAATGVGVVEVYDLDQAADSKLANIASRGFIEAGDNVMIGGLIIGGNGTDNARVLLRAIGPSLRKAGVADALQDPTLELRDSNGELLRENDNWQESQQAEIEATTIPPSDPAEAAIVTALPSGNYTAVVRGKNESAGVGLVEVYNLR